jgi:predicted DNA-binding transcriptional regulator AlpA
MPDTIHTPKHYLRKRQVCERYACSATWIKNHQEKDSFPAAAMHVAARPLWLVSDLDRWDTEQAAKPKPPVRDMTIARAARQVRS